MARARRQSRLRSEFRSRAATRRRGQPPAGGDRTSRASRRTSLSSDPPPADGPRSPAATSAAPAVGTRPVQRREGSVIFAGHAGRPALHARLPASRRAPSRARRPDRFELATELDGHRRAILIRRERRRSARSSVLERRSAWRATPLARDACRSRGPADDALIDAERSRTKLRAGALARATRGVS